MLLSTHSNTRTSPAWASNAPPASCCDIQQRTTRRGGSCIARKRRVSGSKQPSTPPCLCSPAAGANAIHFADVPVDDEREQARRQRRTLFTLADWRKHRSGSRYLHHVQTIIESGVAKSVLLPVLCFTCLAAVVAVWSWGTATPPLWWPAQMPPAPSIAIEPLQLTSIALSLLLVFRTNASYARWEEARRMFGRIPTTARDIARQAFAWFPAHDSTSKAAVARWLVALARCAMIHVRDEHDLDHELSHVLPAAELARLRNSKHRPNFCLQMLTKLLAHPQVPEHHLVRMDENMSIMVEAMSACERIINTPVPLSYTRHTSRFLIFWLCAVPFTLWGYCSWAMVPLTTLVAFVLLGIEEIGVFIEEPFSVMALECFCERLEVHMASMLKDHEEVASFVQQEGYAQYSGLQGTGHLAGSLGYWQAGQLPQHMQAATTSAGMAGAALPHQHRKAQQHPATAKPGSHPSVPGNGTAPSGEQLPARATFPDNAADGCLSDAGVRGSCKDPVLQAD